MSENTTIDYQAEQDAKIGVGIKFRAEHADQLFKYLRSKPAWNADRDGDNWVALVDRATGDMLLVEPIIYPRKTKSAAE